MLEPTRHLKSSSNELNDTCAKTTKKSTNIPIPANQDPTISVSELPSMKVHKKETISLEAQLDPETIEAFASIDHFLTPKEYEEVLIKLKLDSDFNQSAALYEATYSKSSTNFSIPALSNMYKNANQERYGVLMRAYIEMGTFLKNKLDWNFYQTLTFFCCARHCMQKTLMFSDYNDPEFELTLIHQGFPRTNGFQETSLRVRKHPYDNLAKFPYEGLAQFFAEKQKATGKKKFYYVVKDYNNETICLSLAHNHSRFSSNSPDFYIVHTEVIEIEKALKHVDFLYKQVKSSDNKEEIINLSGKIFWWICQTKPWDLGDPSIAEMLFRSIWSEKGIPNDPWISSIIPWCETLTEFDVEKFAENFDKLFDRPTVNKTKIATDNFNVSH